MHEMVSHPERVKRFFASHSLLKPQKMLKQYREGVSRGKYKDIDPEQFFVNLISLCVFPFAAKPIIQTAFNLNDDAYMKFILRRKEQLSDWILHGMRKK